MLAIRQATSEAPAQEIKKHVGAIHVKGGLTLLQRKASNVLLLNAYHELPDPTVHEHTIALSDLAAAIQFNSNNHRALKETLEALVDLKLVWNVLVPGGQREWGAGSLLAAVRIRDGSGVCRYQYSQALRELLHNPQIYARVNLLVQTRFTSAAGLALYENCLRFVRTGSTGWISVDDWRGLLGVGEDQYTEYRRFWPKVLKPAIRQVNEQSDIRIEMETKRESRRITALRFAVRAAPAAALAALGTLSEDLPQLHAGLAVDAGDPAADPSGSDGVRERVRAALRQFGLTPDQIQEFEDLPEETVQRNVDWTVSYVQAGGRIKRSAAGLLIAAIRGDYAGAEDAGRQAQRSLFDTAPTAAPAPSPAVAAAEAHEAAEAELSRLLDRHIEALSVDERAALDAEAVQGLRANGSMYWREIQTALQGGDEASLGAMMGGVLRVARRDAMSERMEAPLS